jgi:flagellar motor switch protein FliM
MSGPEPAAPGQPPEARSPEAEPAEPAAATEAERGAEAPARAGTHAERLLSQDEIDNLLGLRADPARLRNSGILSIINPNDITYERLPMLEVVFDRLERIMTSSIRNLTAQNVDISLSAVTAQRFGDYLNSIPLPAMIAVVKAVEWDNYALITLDGNLVYAMVEVLLGGRSGPSAFRSEGRPYTTIEIGLVERVVKIILSDLAQAFAPVTTAQFRLERIETNPRFAAIARPGNACVVFKLAMSLEDRGGTVEFLLPYATLEPVRDLLLQMFMGEKFGRDPIWEDHFARKVAVTDVELEAVLEELTLPLDEVIDFAIGTVLPLNVGPLDLVTLRCGHVPMLRGRLGRSGDKIAVAIEERLSDHRE